MAFEGLSINISATTADARAGINAVKESMEKTGRQAIALAGEADIAAGQIDNVGEQATESAVALRLLASGFDSVGDQARGASASMATFSGVTLVTNTHLGTMIGLVGALTPLLAGLAGPLTAVTTALAGVGLGAGVVLLGGVLARFKELKTVVKNIGEDLRVILAEFGREQGFGQLLIEGFRALPNLLRRVLDSLGDLTPFVNFLRFLGETASDTLPALTGQLAQLGRQALPALKELVTTLVNGAGPALNTLLNLSTEIEPELISFAAAVADLLPSLTDFGTSLLDTILPALTVVVNIVDDGLEAFNSLSAETQELIIIAGGLAVVLLGVGSVIAGVIGSAVGLIGSLVSVAGAVSTVVTALGGLSVAAPIALGALAFVGTIGGILIATLAGLAAQVTAVALAFREDFGGIRTTAERTLARLGQLFSKHLGPIQREVGILVDNIAESLIPAINKLLKVATKALPIIARLFGDSFELAANAVVGTVDALLSATRVLLNILNNDYKSAIDVGQSFAQRSAKRRQESGSILGSLVGDAARGQLAQTQAKGRQTFNTITVDATVQADSREGGRRAADALTSELRSKNIVDTSR